jgi:hypothetical protein
VFLKNGRMLFLDYDNSRMGDGQETKSACQKPCLPGWRLA